jgi:hypothetical protein
MNDILVKAREYWMLVATRAIAHEKSAESHRYRGTQLGIAATALSALVSTAIFATVTSQLGLNTKGNITIPQGGWALLIYLGLGFLLILAPVLAGVQTYLNDPEQADKHRVSWAGYYRVQQHIDIFLLRYADANAAATEREEALRDLGDISKEIEDLCRNSITLTRGAYAEAAKQLQAAMPQPPAAVQPPLNSPIK